MTHDEKQAHLTPPFRCPNCFNEGITAAAAIADQDADPQHGRLCQDPSHDDRYCGTCEAMRDEADVLGQKIRAAKL